jgi:hypothetical protein
MRREEHGEATEGERDPVVEELERVRKVMEQKK